MYKYTLFIILSNMYNKEIFVSDPPTSMFCKKAPSGRMMECEEGVSCVTAIFRTIFNKSAFTRF